MQHKISHCTNLSAAEASVKAIRSLQENDLTVTSHQEHHGLIKALDRSGMENPLRLSNRHQTTTLHKYVRLLRIDVMKRLGSA